MDQAATVLTNIKTTIGSIVAAGLAQFNPETATVWLVFIAALCQVIAWLYKGYTWYQRHKAQRKAPE